MIDAFGRARVSEPTALFSGKVLGSDDTLTWADAQTSGAGTSSSHDSNASTVTISVAGTTAGTRTRSTKSYFNYQAGKSQLILVTGVLGSGAAGITRRMGYFNDNDGLFLELDESTLNIVKRSNSSGSPVDTQVAQASWNIDTFDGTGASGVTLDTSKAQIFFIDFEWLGVGRVRCGFVIDGIIWYAHEFNHANSVTTTFMGRPCLPIRYQIVNDGTGAASDLICICSSVSSEGGASQLGGEFGQDRISAFATGNDTNIYPIMAVRRQSGNEFVHFTPQSLSIACTTTAVYAWRLILNPTVVGNALSFSNVPGGSLMQSDIATTNATTLTANTGTVIACGVASDTNFSRGLTLGGAIGVRIGVNLSGTEDVLVLAIQNQAAAVESYVCALNWLEER